VKVRRSLLKDTVAVQTYSGDSAYGPLYAAAVSIQCHVDQTRRLVRNRDGKEVVSEATLFVHPYDADRLLPESLVTIAGRETRILAVRAQSFRGQSVQVEVNCA
jgi:hypothetical protein